MKYKLYHGNAPYISLNKVHRYVTEEKITNPATEIRTVNADTSDISKILETISTQDLFSPTKILVIKRVLRNKKKDILLEKLPTIFQDNNDTVLIFWEDQKVKSNTKYYKNFGKNIDESEQLNKRTFFTWAREIIKNENIKIDNQALNILAQKTNYEPERFVSELSKLQLNDIDRSITEEDVNILTANTLEESIWSLIDSINSNNTEKSMEILENLHKQSVDPNYTLSMLARNIRLITLTKFLNENRYSSKEIASMLKVQPFLVPSLLSASKKYTNERLKIIYSKLSNLDFQIKTGQIDGVLGLTLICPYL